MNDKQKVVERLLGICECDNEKVACADKCPSNDSRICIRDEEHIGKHFICSLGKHKTFEW